MDIFIRRGAVVESEAFDPDRDDQGVTVIRGDDGRLAGCTMVSRGRVVSVRPGDLIVTDEHGPWPCDAVSFAGLYQPIAEVLTPNGGPA